jgi:predicted nuclease of restriction endonuclease-like (RecB) superfamily
MTAARNHRPDSGKIHVMKSALVKHRAAKPDLSGLSRVLPQIQTLIEASRQHVVSTANLTLVLLYWNVGRVITQDIQQHQKRAEYGEQLINNLGKVLIARYGAGFSARSLRDMRRFFDSFAIWPPPVAKSSVTRIFQPVAGESATRPIRPPVVAESSLAPIGQPPADASALLDIPQPPAVKSSKHPIRQPPAAESEDRITIDFSQHFRLGWTHYRILLSVEAGLKRGFYFEQTAQQRWSKRELQRQIDRALFERVALSRDTKALVRLEKQRGPVETVRYEDAFKDPYLLDFLGLKGAYSEKDFESAILANLQQFLTELGSDFCFVARQFALRIDDDDYWLDLLFYHRRLRCLVAIDLKIGPFVAADKGQMDLYLSWLKKHDWREGENEPVGLILCTSKKHQHVELLLSHGPHKMQVSEYLTQLPSKRLLADRLKIYSRMLANEDHAS